MKEFLNFNSAKISWFRCGGNVSIFCIIENIKELKDIYQKYPDYINKTITVGAGSNILIKDEGIDCLMIKLGDNFKTINLQNLGCAQFSNPSDMFIKAGAGAYTSSVATFAIKNGIIGCEFLSTIPGTIGGTIKTNAGCFGKEIKDILYSAEILIDGKIRTLYNKDFSFSYRHGELHPNAVVLSAVLKLKKGSNDNIVDSQKEIARMREHRKNNQIIGATCGSTFKNPIDKEGKTISAWKLLDEVGLRGYAIGGAKFSEQHCNFIINNGNANANDIIQLIILAKNRVRNHFNIELQTEIQIF